MKSGINCESLHNPLKYKQSIRTKKIIFFYWHWAHPPILTNILLVMIKECRMQANLIGWIRLSCMKDSIHLLFLLFTTHKLEVVDLLELWQNELSPHVSDFHLQLVDLHITNFDIVFNVILFRFLCDPPREKKEDFFSPITKSQFIQSILLRKGEFFWVFILSTSFSRVFSQKTFQSRLFFQNQNEKFPLLVSKQNKKGLGFSFQNHLLVIIFFEDGFQFILRHIFQFFGFSNSCCNFRCGCHDCRFALYPRLPAGPGIKGEKKVK